MVSTSNHSYSLNKFRLLLLLLICLYGFEMNAQKPDSYPVLNTNQDIIVFGIGNKVPADARVIKRIRTGEKGFKPDCDYDVIIRLAKLAARKSGGNAIKIITHTPPTALGNYKHRLTADILHIENPEEVKDRMDEEVKTDDDFAILHVYRYGGPGFLVGYNIMMSDTVLCRVRNNFSEIFLIREEGIKTLWAQTEARSQVSIDFRFGNEYYLRCDFNMGAVVGIPKLELVDRKSGESELEYFRTNPR